MTSCAIHPKGLVKLENESWVHAYSPTYTEVQDIPIRYVKTGEGPPLLLIHTIRTQIDYWKFLLPELSKHYTVYALDLPGHGFSGLPDTTYTHAFFHGVVRDFIQQQELTNLTLVAESAGATVALSLGADTSVSLKEIFACNPYDYSEKKGAGAKRSNGFSRLVFSLMQPKPMGPIAIRMELKFVLKKILAGGFYDKKKMPKDVLHSVYKVSKRKGFKRAELRYFMSWQSFVDARETYSKIQVPVTLIYGQQDWSTVEDRNANASLIPQVELVTLEESSHFSCLEQPDAILKRILK